MQPQNRNLVALLALTGTAISAAWASLKPVTHLQTSVLVIKMTDRSVSTAGARLAPQDRLIALELGNGNLSQGIRFALRLAAKQQAKAAKLSTILKSAAVMAARMEQQ